MGRIKRGVGKDTAEIPRILKYHATEKSTIALGRAGDLNHKRRREVKKD